MAFEIARVYDVFSRLDLAAEDREVPVLPSAGAAYLETEAVYSSAGLSPPSGPGASQLENVQGLLLLEVQAAAARERQRQRDAALLAGARLAGWEDVTSAATPVASTSQPDIPQGQAAERLPHADSAGARHLSSLFAAAPVGHHVRPPPVVRGASRDFELYGPGPSPWAATPAAQPSAHHRAPGGPSPRRQAVTAPASCNSAASLSLGGSGFPDWRASRTGHAGALALDNSGVQVRNRGPALTPLLWYLISLGSFARFRRPLFRNIPKHPGQHPDVGCASFPSPTCYARLRIVS